MRLHMKHLALGLTLIAGLVAGMPRTAWPTVTNTTVSTTTGLGNGSTTNFVIGFAFLDNSWLSVVEHDNSTGLDTSISQGSGAGKFTVSGGNPGTTVVMGTAPSITQFLKITRGIPLTQTVAFSPAGIFPYQGLSNQMDQITMTLQNLNAGIPSGGGGGGGGGGASTPAYETPYNLWGWDSSGSTLVEYPGSAVTLSSNDILKFNGSGWTNYNLSASNLMTLLGGQTASVLASGAGGTGVSNAGTLTYGHNLTFTTSNDTNLTLPTSGTVVTGTTATGNVAGDIVVRDGSGNFSSNQITANSFVGPVTGAVTGNVTGNVSGTSANVTGVVAIGHGGTGQTTQQAAINGLLAAGAQSVGSFARWDGSNVTLAPIANTDLPANIAWSKMAQQTHNSLLWSDNSGNEGVIPTNVNTGYVLTSNGVAPYWAPSAGGESGLFTYGADTGSANAYVVATPNPAVASLTAGVGVSFVAANANSGTSTLDVSSLGAVTIVHPDGTNLIPGDIVAGQMTIVQYDGALFQLINPDAQTYGAVSHQWINAVGAGGVFSSSQPDFSDLSGTSTKGQLPATTVYTDQANTYSAGPQSLGTQVLSVQIANDSPGTTLNKLAKIDSAGKLTIVAVTDTQGASGVVVAGAGTSGSADIAQIGQVTCVFDGTATAGDYVQISSSTAGDCHDAGGSLPSSGQTVGRVITGGVGPGSYTMEALIGSGGSSGSSGITNITGDMVVNGPGSVPGTLATVNGNVGSFGSSTAIPSFVVNGKGLITSATTSAVIAPAGTLTGATLASGVTASSLTSLGTQAANLDMGSHKIVNLTDPTSVQDAATKNYVDTQLAQLNPAAAVVAASTANIAGTYSNLVGGVCIGDTFTTTATTAFALDGVSPALNARVLLKDQTSSFQDGVWILTTQAVGGVSGAILTRATDSDSSSDFNSGQIVPIVNGTVNAGSSYYQTATNTTCNTSTQTWTQFQKASSAYLQSANNLSDVATPNTALNNILPSQTSNSGKVLQTNGTNTSWVTPGSSGITNLANDIIANGPGSVGATVAAIQGNTVLGTTGTGSVMFSASPTTTGLLNAASIRASGSVTVGTNVGIGTVSPSSIASIDIVNTSGATQVIQQTGYGGTVGYRAKYANGTLGSPTASTSGNILDFLSGRGYGTTGFAAAGTGAINVTAQSSFTDSSMPTSIDFMTTSTGTVAATLAGTFNPSGQLTMPKFYSGLGLLDVNASGSVATLANGAITGQVLVSNGSSIQPSWQTVSVLPGAAWAGAFEDPGANFTCSSPGTTPTDFTSASNTTLSVISSQGMTCTYHGSNLPAIDCTLPTTGPYWVCGSGNVTNASVTNFEGMFLSDGGGATIGTWQNKSLDATAFRACGVYNAASTTVTFKMQASANNNNNMQIEQRATISTFALEFDVHQITGTTPGNVCSNPITITTSATASIANQCYVCDATSGAVTLTLPGAMSTALGFKFSMKKKDATTNACIFKGNASDLIDGANTLTIPSRYQAIEIVNDQTQWWAF